MFATPAYAQAAGAAGAGTAFAQFIPLVLIFLIMYFLMIRPQQRRAKQHRQMVEKLTKGDQIITAGGLVGKVVGVRDDELDVEIAPSVKVRVVRATVTQVVTPTTPVAANT